MNYTCFCCKEVFGLFEPYPNHTNISDSASTIKQHVGEMNLCVRNPKWKPMIKTISINAYQIAALIDTGSVINILREDAYIEISISAKTCRQQIIADMNRRCLRQYARHKAHWLSIIGVTDSVGYRTNIGTDNSLKDDEPV